MYESNYKKKYVDFNAKNEASKHPYPGWTAEILILNSEIKMKNWGNVLALHKAR